MRTNCNQTNLQPREPVLVLAVVAQAAGAHQLHQFLERLAHRVDVRHGEVLVGRLSNIIVVECVDRHRVDVRHGGTARIGR
jgi:hypothetical protein